MEFGSDFHKITSLPVGLSLSDIYKEHRLYANGRQALEAILIANGVRCVWIPSYYCHESVSGLSRLGVKVVYYPCTPLTDPDKVIDGLNLGHGDALVLMNHFGLHKKPKTPKGHFLLIEDHSHDLISRWAIESDADWCFASLRKTIPIADGGILWSPKGLDMPMEAPHTQFALQNAALRYTAMAMKADYLAGKISDKETYLSMFRTTEDNLDRLPLSAISTVSKEILSTLDIRRWEQRKKNNWQILTSRLVVPRNYILTVENDEETLFSLILCFDSHSDREKVRKNLISNQVYPAVLWTIPIGVDTASEDFGSKMLSIHCDGRYAPEQMTELAKRINQAIDK